MAWAVPIVVNSQSNMVWAVNSVGQQCKYTGAFSPSNKHGHSHRQISMGILTRQTSTGILKSQNVKRPGILKSQNVNNSDPHHLDTLNAESRNKM